MRANATYTARCTFAAGIGIAGLIGVQPRSNDDARAVFHDRTQMEQAVRALELEGVRRGRIHVSRVGTAGGGVQRAPESGSVLSIGGAIGSAIGGGIAMLSILWVAGDPRLLAVVVRVLVGAAGGAFIGALVALIAMRLRSESRYPHHGGHYDYLVRVKTHGSAAAESVRDLLTSAGGDVLTTSA